MNTFVFLRKNLILYFVLLGSLVFIYSRSTISLYLPFFNLRESEICKCEVGVWDCVESLQNLFYGLTRGLSNLCENASLITSSSTSVVKSIGFPVIWFSLVIMKAKSKLNVEYLDIDPTILKNTENLLKPSWISNSGRQFS